MSLPVIVIVGRPNVGKSSLLNCLARERISIVDARAGITRDRVSTIIEHEGRYLELVDTGGIGIVDVDHLEDHVETQINYAIAKADLVLFLLDALQGIVPLDQRVAELLRKAKKPVLAVANKVDAGAQRVEASTFYALGFGEAVCVSALHGHGRRELLDRICAEIGPDTGETPETPVMKLAIVGKRNAGKSTLVNALAGEPRVIVSETPGTTRDAVDVQFEKDGKKYIAIDTAGVRKKSKMDDIDFYSYTRALSSIRRADVVMLLIDASLPVGDVDQKLAAAVLEEEKPVLLAINKWDLARDVADTDSYDEYLSRMFPHLRFAPIVIMTARDGRNVDAAIDVALGLHRQAQTRVSTARLNEAIRAIVGEREPMPRYGTKRIKIYYGTQVSVAPPTIVLFCNNPELVTENYRRFMENRMREILPFVEVPMRLLFRRSGEAREFGRSAGREKAEEGSQTTADSD
ncbi:MAG: ribosome biogenesis GTPase Der [Phycisphaerales bacterium]|nr:ribosome biogenesis GTPase Der [Phycisphaerales bacterium]